MNWEFYQTLQTGSLTIGRPAGQLNAPPDSGMLLSTPLVRYFSGECGSVIARIRAASGRVCPRQLSPYPPKTRCTGVSPSTGISDLCPVKHEARDERDAVERMEH